MVYLIHQDRTSEYATGLDPARSAPCPGRVRARLIVIDPMERTGHESWPACVAWRSKSANRHGSHSRGLSLRGVAVRLRSWATARCCGGCRHRCGEGVILGWWLASLIMTRMQGML